MWRLYYYAYLWFTALCVVLANLVGLALTIVFGGLILKFIIFGG